MIVIVCPTCDGNRKLALDGRMQNCRECGGMGNVPDKTAENNLIVEAGAEFGGRRTEELLSWLADRSDLLVPWLFEVGVLGSTVWGAETIFRDQSRNPWEPEYIAPGTRKVVDYDFRAEEIGTEKLKRLYTVNSEVQP